MKVLIFPFDNKRHVKFHLGADRKENSHYVQNRVSLFYVSKITGINTRMTAIFEVTADIFNVYIIRT
jgi:hypothetical protein